MLFSYAVRAIYIESCSMFVRGGVYKVVHEAMGGTLAKFSVSALMFDYVLTGPISGVSAGLYLGGLVNEMADYVGRRGWHVNTQYCAAVFASRCASASHTATSRAPGRFAKLRTRLAPQSPVPTTAMPMRSDKALLRVALEWSYEGGWNVTGYRAVAGRSTTARPGVAAPGRASHAARRSIPSTRFRPFRLAR